MANATLEKNETMVQVTIGTQETPKGVSIRVHPVDMGQPDGPAVEVKRGETIRVKRSLANLLIANKQATLGAVKLDGK